MPEKSLILTGFMGSGKSSVGVVLAKRLGSDFIDLDAEIVRAAGRSINEIFADEGEAVFRSMESGMLKNVLAAGCANVVATGGGAVISPENRSLMRTYGIIINLNVSIEQVMLRIRGCCDRPLLAVDDASERARTLINQREQFYADADIRIDTDGKSVEDVAAEILCRLKELAA
ncbi:MAG: shikimate kinase [Desulfuromonadaceae bacterium]|nr:shikimate kinase [Desulfuromonadaceae bacterium]MDD2855157.1 shikimate kinase [Desulfuromonadaceae bacterium]